MNDEAAHAEVEADEFDEVEGDGWPFSIVPDWVALAPISALACRVYWLLRSYANKASAGGTIAFPGQSLLATICGYAKTQPIGKAIAELVEIGAVSWRWKNTPRGRRIIYRTYVEPRADAAYRGPAMTSDLTADVLAGMVAERSIRGRGRAGAQVVQACQVAQVDQVHQVVQEPQDAQAAQVDQGEQLDLFAEQPAETGGEVPDAGAAAPTRTLTMPSRPRRSGPCGISQRVSPGPGAAPRRWSGRGGRRPRGKGSAPGPDPPRIG